MQSVKRCLLLIFAVCLLVACLSACKASYEKDGWFSETYLEECGVPQLPGFDNKTTFKKTGSDVLVSLPSSAFEKYIASVHNYLKGQNFPHLGTRGDMIGTLAGMFTTYYFDSAEELAEFRGNDGYYRFIYSKGERDDSGELIFYILVIYNGGTQKLTYDHNKTFAYNTTIALHKGSESILSGHYKMRKYDILYWNDDLPGMILEGYLPETAEAGQTVVIRTHPIMDADMILYANDVPMECTHADADYWEYTFTMPEKDVLIKREIFGGGPAEETEPT